VQTVGGTVYHRYDLAVREKHVVVHDCDVVGATLSGGSYKGIVGNIREIDAWAKQFGANIFSDMPGRPFCLIPTTNEQLRRPIKGIMHVGAYFDPTEQAYNLGFVLCSISQLLCQVKKK